MMIPLSFAISRRLAEVRASIYPPLHCYSTEPLSTTIKINHEPSRSISNQPFFGLIATHHWSTHPILTTSSPALPRRQGPRDLREELLPRKHAQRPRRLGGCRDHGRLRAVLLVPRRHLLATSRGAPRKPSPDWLSCTYNWLKWINQIGSNRPSEQMSSVFHPKHFQSETSTLSSMTSAAPPLLRGPTLQIHHRVGNDHLMLCISDPCTCETFLQHPLRGELLGRIPGRFLYE